MRPLVLLVAAGILCACAGAPATTATVPTYLPIGTLSPTSLVPHTTPTIAILPTAGPSATPVSYTIRANDTLSLIALRYGVTIEALQAANPGVNPNMLSIGQRIIIPAPAGTETEVPPATASPVPVPLRGPSCFRAPSDTLRCLVTAQSDGKQTLEGLTVLVTLIDGTGHPVLTGTAYAPLNLLLPGQPMVLDALFAAPAPDYAEAVATLAGAVPLAADDKRYVDTVVSVASSTPGSDALSWRVEGNLALGPKAASAADRVSIIVLAMDANGNVVGYTKWESPSAITPGAQTGFDLTVYSLGPRIDSVEMQSEAQVSLVPTP